MHQFPENSSKCQELPVMENGTIAQRQISDSSQCDIDDASNQGRLHFTAIVSEQRAWVAVTTEAEQWLQVDLGSDHMIARVTRIKTQGRRGVYSQWVTKYKIQYSHDEGDTHQYYRDQGQTTDKVKYKYY